MKVERKGVGGPWNIAAAVMAVFLLGNFLLFCGFCIFALGMAFDPTLAFLTGAELLLGLALVFLMRKKEVKKLWRRLLFAGIACNFLIIAFLCVTVFIMLAVWQ